MAATAFPSATDAAVEIFQSGGNAIDAAVAAAWALAVCEPSGSGLGGKTLMLIHFAAGRNVVIDGHSQAPAAVSKKRVKRSQQKKGYLATTIPATVATLGYAHRLYGALPLQRVMEPAIRLAEEGYPVTRLHSRQLKWCLADLRASPTANALFLAGGRPFMEGNMFRQPILARTLRRLAQFGTDDFYKGGIGRDIVEDMTEHGGLITQQDLEDCALPIERNPVTTSYRGHQVISVPPPGGGLQVLLALKILENCSPAELRDETHGWYKIIAQVLRAVFRECDSSPVTLENLTPSAFKWFLSDERAAEIFRSLNWRNAGLSLQKPKQDEPGETTHLCTGDSRGNAVSLTQSIQSLFGAKVANEKLGFLYNNCLSTCPRYHHPYQLAGRCIPRSNAAPTIVLTNRSCSTGAPDEGPPSDWRPILVLGAAGSRRITAAILQVTSSVIDRGLSLAEAVNSPREHVMLSGKVHIEKSSVASDLREHFAKRFGEVRIRARHSYYMGAVQAIQFGQDGSLIGMADPRRDGTSGGI
jgi:gamma-glutamyltranspeptidase/glutathione hydrolase